MHDILAPKHSRTLARCATPLIALGTAGALALVPLAASGTAPQGRPAPTAGYAHVAVGLPRG